MENDYISRADAVRALMERHHYDQSSVAALYAILVADVRPVVRGRWIELENPNYSPFDPTSQEYELLCSNCGATHYGADRNFCPACGADMMPEPGKEDET